MSRLPPHLAASVPSVVRMSRAVVLAVFAVGVALIVSTSISLPAGSEIAAAPVPAASAAMAPAAAPGHAFVPTTVTLPAPDDAPAAPTF